MKKVILLASTIGAALMLIGCTPAAVKDPQIVQNVTAGTESCMGCHGDGTAMNEKIQNARDSWMTSAHANGQTGVLLDPDSSKIIAHEQEGTNTFYANGGGCQICHTKEGFNKKASGKYADQAAIDTDFIKAPSSLTCFTCHKPHTNGNFDLVIAPDKAVTLTSGAVYNKNKGSLCADCHQARTTAAGAEADAIAKLKDTSSSGGITSRFGPHHGPQADLLLGKAGAQYANKTYSNGSHTSNKDANCITCHMTYPEGKRFSGAASLAGHSFNAVADVHGKETANTAGCVTCHESIKTGNQSSPDGHMLAGDVYFMPNGTSKAHYDDINRLLKTLADPGASGAGLLQSAYALSGVAGSGKTITWSTNGRYWVSAINKLTDTGATADSPKVRFAKAMYNYMYILEDKSFGVHNPTYAKQLLIDTCQDLETLGATTSVIYSGIARP